MGLLWEVVGGAASGGVIVRKGYELSSELASGGRLATGSLVGELQLEGERLHFVRLTGAGPDEGWVTVRQSHNNLLVSTDKRLSVKEYEAWNIEELQLCREVGCTPEALSEALGYMQMDQDDFSSSLTRRIKGVQLAKIAAPKQIPALMDGHAQVHKESHIEPICEQHHSICNEAHPSTCQQPFPIHKDPFLDCKAFSQQSAPVPKWEPPSATPHMAKAMVVEEAKTLPKESIIPSSSSGVMPPQILPAQKFEVVHESVEVREKPSLESQVIDTKVKGQYILGAKETFDGWVKLDGEFGWASKHKFGWGATLLPVEREVLLVQPKVAEEPGPQMFEVIYKPRLDVHAAPAKTSKVQGSKEYGEAVLADAQTYNGWVKLSNNSGWMLGIQPDQGTVLRCTSEGEQRVRQMARINLSEACARRKSNEMDSAISQAMAAGITEEEIDDVVFAEPPEWRQKCSTALGWLSYAQSRGVDRDELLHNAWNKLDDAVADHDPRALWDAILEARMYGFGREEFVYDAEVKLREMRKKGDSCSNRKRCKMHKRITQAQAAGNIRELRDCVEACSEAGFHDEWVMAAGMVDQLSKAKNQARNTKDEALDELAAVVASGDVAATRAAKDAAKAAGATRREISRIYALHCSGEGMAAD